MLLEFTFLYSMCALARASGNATWMNDKREGGGLQYNNSISQHINGRRSLWLNHVGSEYGGIVQYNRAHDQLKWPTARPWLTDRPTGRLRLIWVMCFILWSCLPFDCGCCQIHGAWADFWLYWLTAFKRTLSRTTNPDGYMIAKKDKARTCVP